MLLIPKNNVARLDLKFNFCEIKLLVLLLFLLLFHLLDLLDDLLALLVFLGTLVR